MGDSSFALGCGRRSTKLSSRSLSSVSSALYRDLALGAATDAAGEYIKESPCTEEDTSGADSDPDAVLRSSIEDGFGAGVGF
jgi:hypothetical protein